VCSSDLYCRFLAWTAQGDLLATTGKLATVQCYDGSTLEARWVAELQSGAPWTIYAFPNAEGSRVYVSGMFPANTQVLDGRTGAFLHSVEGDPLYPGWGYWELSATSEDRVFIASHDAISTVVYDGNSFAERYRRFEFAGETALAVAPSLVCRGDAAAVEGIHIALGETAYALDSFAPVLFDPKRFQAAAEGIVVRRPHLPAPPEVIGVSPEGRTVAVDEDRVVVQVSASGGGGVLGFQLEREGELLPFGSEGAIERHESGCVTLSWAIDRAGTKETDLRIRAVGASGALSRPALLTIVWK